MAIIVNGDIIQEGTGISAFSTGGVQSGVVEVDLGASETDSGSATVTAAWVGAGSKIICTPNAIATADHDPDDYAVEAITAYVTNIVPGVSFDVVVRAPFMSFGKFSVNWIGV